MNISQEIASAVVNPGKIAVFFMGQAGFVFKLSDGTCIAIDLYLSDCCERYFGFKRMTPKIMPADGFTFDYVISSHAHYDHFDVDSIPLLLSNQKTKLIAAHDVKKEAKRLALRKEQITYLRPGEIFSRENFKIIGTKCDHGELAPDALGILIESEGKKIYFTGDTCLREDLLENEDLQNCDLVILPINGAFGNLNSDDAAKLISSIKPKLAVPCHFWTFAEHGGNPGEFAAVMNERYPESNYRFMQMGEKIYI